MKHAQKLVSLIALCPPCHSVKHIGRTIAIGRGVQAAAHMAKVNQWTAEQVAEAVNKAFQKYAERSQFPWTLDLSWLENKGIQVGEGV